MAGVVRDVAAVLALSLAAAAGAIAQGGIAPHTVRPAFAAEAAATAHPLDPAERDARVFLKRAAASSRFQADAARLALARSPTAAVRSLAGSLQDQHIAAGNDLLHMLHQRGLAAPMMENAQRRSLSRLARVPARRFDRDYLEAVLSDLRANVELFARASATVQDAVLTNWIAGRMPALRDDVDNAQQRLATIPAPRPRPAARGSHRPRPHRHHSAE